MLCVQLQLGCNICNHQLHLLLVAIFATLSCKHCNYIQWAESGGKGTYARVTYKMSIFLRAWHKIRLLPCPWASGYKNYRSEFSYEVLCDFIPQPLNTYSKVLLKHFINIFLSFSTLNCCFPPGNGNGSSSFRTWQFAPPDNMGWKSRCQSLSWSCQSMQTATSWKSYSHLKVDLLCKLDKIWDFSMKVANFTQ